MKTIWIWLLVISVVLVACSKPLGPAADLGDLVTVEYEATLADGSLFDSSQDYDVPVTFTVGKQEVLPGLETAVIGMHAGEQKKILLTPESAYGMPTPDKIELIPLEEFPNWAQLRIGMNLSAGDMQTGEQIQGKVITITPEGITVDFNHPLAGKSLWLEITVKKIVKG